MDQPTFLNPFRPGAGHMPPYLAGRNKETEEFSSLLKQDVILSNCILTGLRGIGKTVLLDTFMPMAVKNGWVWTGSTLSESASVSESSLVLRILTDLSLITADIIIDRNIKTLTGFNGKKEVIEQKMDIDFLLTFYKSIPGLTSDKLRGVLECVWEQVKKIGIKGVIFAYDEAQTMADASDKNEYPLSVLLDIFQSIQKKGILFMLVLVGLPTLFPKLVETRTYSERMFRVITLTKLKESDSRDAVMKPIGDTNCPVKFNEDSIRLIIKASGGYPYFIQFICREVYDIFFQKLARGEKEISIPLNEIIAKLDSDFFSGRWMRATDRQRELLEVVAELVNCDEEFTIAEVVQKAKEIMKRPMGDSQINQTLSVLTNNGLIYKNRYGKYSFAVPLLGQYIKRQKNI